MSQLFTYNIRLERGCSLGSTGKNIFAQTIKRNAATKKTKVFKWFSLRMDACCYDKQTGSRRDCDHVIEHEEKVLKVYVGWNVQLKKLTNSFLRYPAVSHFLAHLSTWDVRGFG